MKPLLRSAAVLLIGLGAYMPCAAQQLYRWVDENGRVQYSDRPPPPGAQSQAKPIKKRPAAPGEGQASPTYAEQEAEFRKRQVERSERQAREREEQQAAAERKKQCTEARNHLAGLKSGAPFVKYNPQGEREFLDDQGRAAEIQRVEKTVAILCK